MRIVNAHFHDVSQYVSQLGLVKVNSGLCSLIGMFEFPLVWEKTEHCVLQI